MNNKKEPYAEIPIITERILSINTKEIHNTQKIELNKVQSEEEPSSSRNQNNENDKILKIKENSGHQINSYPLNNQIDIIKKDENNLQNNQQTTEKQSLNNKNKNNFSNEESIKSQDDSKLFSADYKKIFFLILNGSIGFFFMGYHLGVYNTIQDTITKTLQWTDEQKTALLAVCSCIVPIGALFGGIISGKIASMKIGRRGSIMLYHLIGLIGSLISIIGNTPSFIIGRFIVGFVVGAFSTVVPLFIKEFIPVEMIGKGGMIYFALFCLGLLSGFCLGFKLPSDINLIDPSDSWWRLMMLFPSIFGFLNVLLFVFIYKNDTPMFLVIQRNDIASARNSLKFIYKDEKEIELLIEKYILIRKFILEKGENYDVSYKDLFTKKYRIRFIIGIIFNIGQQTTAMNIFTLYSNLIYIKTEPNVNATLYSSFFTFSEVVGILIAIFIIEKMGRRKLLLLGFTAILICLIAITVLYFLNIFWPQKFIIIVYFFFAGVSMDPIIWIINADLLPDIGVGICSTVNWITCIIVVVSFPYMLEPLQLQGIFLIYTVLTFVIVVFMFFVFKETKDKTEIDIEKIYARWFS